MGAPNAANGDKEVADVSSAYLDAKVASPAGLILTVCHTHMIGIVYGKCA